MSEEIEYPRDFADRIYRESLKNPENLRDLVSAVLPDISSGFVFDRAELLDVRKVFQSQLISTDVYSFLPDSC